MRQMMLLLRKNASGLPCWLVADVLTGTFIGFVRFIAQNGHKKSSFQDFCSIYRTNTALRLPFGAFLYDKSYKLEDKAIIRDTFVRRFVQIESHASVYRALFISVRFSYSRMGW